MVMLQSFPCCNKLFITTTTHGLIIAKSQGLGIRIINQMVFKCMTKDVDIAPDMGAVLRAVPNHVNDAAGALRAGHVIAVPTDTLYGLACDACSAAAIQKMYEIKRRSLTTPLAVCVADVEDFEHYAVVDHLPKGLLYEVLPGPVTLVLNRGDNSILDKSLNPGISSIGIRVPDSNFIRMIARSFKGALALTSANLSSQPSTTQIEEFKNLWPECKFIFDAGLLPAGRLGSTIIDLTTPGYYKILRPGSALQLTTSVLSKFGLSEFKPSNLKCA